MTNQQLSIKLFNESIAMRHDGNYIEAINLQKQSIEAYPDDPDITENYYSLGKTYYLAGDYKKAVDCYKVYNGLCVIKTPAIVIDYNAYLTGDIAATQRFMSSYANLARNTGYAFRNMSSGKGPGDWDIWYRYMLMGKDPNSMPDMAKYKRDNIENDERATQDGMFVISTWFKEFSSDFYKTKQIIIDLATDIVQTKDNISVENTYRASDKIIAEYEAKIKELTGLLQQSQAAYEKAKNKNREYEAKIKELTGLLQSNKASKQVYTFDYNNAKANKLNQYIREEHKMMAGPAISFNNVAVGNIIKFGSYPQSEESRNEPIEWLVLAVDNGKALLISKYALDCKKYNETYESTTWEECTLCEWLNNDFIKFAFNGNEQNSILLSDVKADKNPKYGTSQGNDIKDKVFLLSVTEAERYLKFDRYRNCKPTKFAVKNGAYVHKDNGNCWWWLRSLGSDNKSATGISTAGSMVYYGNSVKINDNAIRPALWININ